MDWVWSDPHFGHENIILYEGRPFAGPDEMDAALLLAWSKTVGQMDRLFCLGDVSLHRSRAWLREQIGRMPGRKYLILGNHDRDRSPKWWRETGFDEVFAFPILYEGFFILSHEPQYVTRAAPYVNVHGHTHGTSSNNPQQVNVSVEVTDYRPVSLSAIRDRFAVNRND